MATKSLKAAKATLAPLGISITYSADYGEYRVYPKGGRGEGAAYYTDDLEDAVATGREMAK